MKAVFIFFFLVVLRCTAQEENENKYQGLWSFSRSEVVREELLNTDAGFYTRNYSGDIFLEGDSIWILDYPCEKLEVRAYSEELFQRINDSTFKYGGENYLRQIFYDTLAIARLKIHKLNADCYQGKWRLIRSESGGDGTGVVFIYPFEPVDLLIIENESVSDGIFSVPINGVEREFEVHIEHPGFPDRLTLSPNNSWKKNERIMWMRYWELPPPNKRELKKIKRGEGEPLKLVYSKTSE